MMLVTTTPWMQEEPFRVTNPWLAARDPIRNRDRLRMTFASWGVTEDLLPRCRIAAGLSGKTVLIDKHRETSNIKTIPHHHDGRDKYCHRFLENQILLNS